MHFICTDTVVFQLGNGLFETARDLLALALEFASLLMLVSFFGDIDQVEVMIECPNHHGQAFRVELVDEAGQLFLFARALFFAKAEITFTQ